MKDGYIKIHRKIIDWDWWSDDAVFRFFIGLLIFAKFKDSVVKGVKVERGSFTTSIPKLCAFMDMSEWKVRMCLKCLQETGEIIDEANNHFRKITIVNYNDYQDILPSQKPKGKPKDKPKGKTKGKPNPIEERKKYDSLTENHTEKAKQAPPAPRASDERGLAVSYGEMRQYQIDSRIGNAGIVTDFYNSFHNSKTKIPADWKSLYQKFAAADRMAQVEFIERLTRGEYRDKWGAADERT